VETRFLILPITPAVTRIAVEFPSPYPFDPWAELLERRRWIVAFLW
jgi:hypothetical protein